MFGKLFKAPKLSLKTAMPKLGLRGALNMKTPPLRNISIPSITKAVKIEKAAKIEKAPKIGSIGKLSKTGIKNVFKI